MHTRIWKTAAALMLAATTALATGHMAEAEGGSRKLEGTWLFQIGLHNCKTGAAVGEPFFSILTFARGGTVAENTSNSMFYPALRGPGQGIWERTGEHTFEAATLAFITVDGVLTKAQSIKQTIEVQDDDTLKTTAASVKFYKPDGTVLATGCAAATGSRFEMWDF